MSSLSVATYPETIRTVSGLIRASRPKQWIKQGLVLAPIAAMMIERVLGSAIMLIPTVIAYCLAASSVYLINDIVDREKDSFHPTKRLRPIASGLLPVRTAAFCAVLYTASALGITAIVSLEVFAVVLVYLALSHLYTFFLKNVPVLDVLLLGSFFALRAVGGFLAVDISPVEWWGLIAFLAAFSLFGALAKRRSECTNVDVSKGTRSTLSFYQGARMQYMFFALVAVVMLSYAYTAMQVNTVLLPAAAVVYMIMRRLWNIVSTPGSDIHPIDLLFADKQLRGMSAACAVFVPVLFLLN